MTLIILRQAIPDDLVKIAKVHYSCWKSTYEGIIDECFLESLDVNQYIELWENIFNGEHMVYLIEINNRVVGFISGGEKRTEHKSPDEGEIYALYILENHQGKGYGSELFKAICTCFKRKKFNSFMLWVMSKNESRLFYEKMGGKKIASEYSLIEGKRYKEYQYSWELS